MKSSLLIIAALFMTSSMLINTASAQIQSATMEVDGMTCPFCIYGIEKKLKSVDEIKDAEANLRSATVDLTFKDNAQVSIQRLDKAVDDSGFTPGEIEISASGQLEQYELDDKDFPALKVTGSEQIFLLTASEHHGHEEYIGSEKLAELKENASKSGGVITISGRIHQHSDELPLALSVKNFHPYTQ